MQMHHKSVRSRGAIALGTIFFIGALILLFWDFVEARSLAGFTQSHMYILLSFGAAYGAGHFMMTSFEWSVGGFLRPIAFFMLFCIATSICIGFSGGRTAESFVRREDDATYQNALRLNQEGRIVTAKADADAAKAAYDKAQAVADDAMKSAAEACNTGPGPICRGKTKTADAATANAKALYERYEKADAWHRTQLVRLDNPEMKPPAMANANLKQIAKAIAFATGRDEERVMEGIMLYLPYALAIITEFGAILCFNFGFSSPVAYRVPVRVAGDLVSIRDIANELGIEPNVARAILRAKKVDRPPQGWAWTQSEAVAIKQMIAKRDLVVVPMPRAKQARG